MRAAYKGSHLREIMGNDYIEEKADRTIEDNKWYLISGIMPSSSRNKDGTARFTIQIDEVVFKE